MKMVKRLVAVLLAGAMLMLLMGCSATPDKVHGNGNAVSEVLRCMNSHRKGEIQIKLDPGVTEYASTLLTYLANENYTVWTEEEDGIRIDYTCNGPEASDIGLFDTNPYVLTDAGLKYIRNGSWKYRVYYEDLVYSMTDAKAQALAKKGEELYGYECIGIATKVIRGKTCLVILVG